MDRAPPNGSSGSSGPARSPSGPFLDPYWTPRPGVTFHACTAMLGPSGPSSKASDSSTTTASKQVHAERGLLLEQPGPRRSKTRRIIIHGTLSYYQFSNISVPPPPLPLSAFHLAHVTPDPACPRGHGGVPARCPRSQRCPPRGRVRDPREHCGVRSIGSKATENLRCQQGPKSFALLPVLYAYVCAVCSMSGTVRTAGGERGAAVQATWGRLLAVTPRYISYPPPPAPSLL